MGRLDEVIKLINLYKVTGQEPDLDLIEELGNPPVEWDQLDGFPILGQVLTFDGKYWTKMEIL